MEGWVLSADVGCGEREMGKSMGSGYREKSEEGT